MLSQSSPGGSTTTIQTALVERVIDVRPAVIFDLLYDLIGGSKSDSKSFQSKAVPEIVRQFFNEINLPIPTDIRNFLKLPPHQKPRATCKKVKEHVIPFMFSLLIPALSKVAADAHTYKTLVKFNSIVEHYSKEATDFVPYVENSKIDEFSKVINEMHTKDYPRSYFLIFKSKIQKIIREEIMALKISAEHELKGISSQKVKFSYPRAFKEEKSVSQSSQPQKMEVDLTASSDESKTEQSKIILGKRPWSLITKTEIQKQAAADKARRKEDHDRMMESVFATIDKAWSEAKAKNPELGQQEDAMKKVRHL